MVSAAGVGEEKEGGEGRSKDKLKTATALTALYCCLMCLPITTPLSFVSSLRCTGTESCSLHSLERTHNKSGSNLPEGRP